jgi:hypothetical protein
MRRNLQRAIALTRQRLAGRAGEPHRRARHANPIAEPGREPVIDEHAQRFAHARNVGELLCRLTRCRGTGLFRPRLAPGRRRVMRHRMSTTER